jgi:hypothetical protein
VVGTKVLRLVLEMFEVGTCGQPFGRHTNSPFTVAPDVRICRLKGSFVTVFS